MENKKFNLFLDDMRIPVDAFPYTKNLLYLELDWDLVNNYDEFVEAIREKGIPDVVSFDHDLDDEHYGWNDQLDDIGYLLYEEKTGYHCAKWLIEYCMDNKKDIPTLILIHSMNPVGRKNIDSLFKTYKKIYGNND